MAECTVQRLSKASRVVLQWRVSVCTVEYVKRDIVFSVSNVILIFGHSVMTLPPP